MSKFPINQLYDDMRKATIHELRQTDTEAAAEYYGLSAEAVRHWLRVIIDEKAQ